MDTRTFRNRLLLTASVVVLLLLAWQIAEVLLLIFLGGLGAVLLYTLAHPIARRTPLPEQGALALVVVVLVIVLAVGGVLVVPTLVAQGERFIVQLEGAIEQLGTVLREQEGIVGDALDTTEGNGLPPFGSEMIGQVAGTFTTTLGALADAVFVVLTALFLAANPGLYRRGALQLVPPQGRERAREVLDKLADTVRGWLLGQLVSMVVIGTVVSIGLALLGVPLALVLGVISGLLEFVPVVGPFLAAIPALLIAFAEGPTRALYVAIFLLVVQQLEGNVLTPLVQRRTVDLPPALTLVAVLAMGLLFGPLGILVATPLAAVVLVLIKMLYLRDVLGEPVEL